MPTWMWMTRVKGDYDDPELDPPPPIIKAVSWALRGESIGC